MCEHVGFLLAVLYRNMHKEMNWGVEDSSTAARVSRSESLVPSRHCALCSCKNTACLMAFLKSEETKSSFPTN